MIRKFNYTGRQKLTHDRISVTLIDDRPYKSFSASINLIGLDLTDDAKIYIEPYFKSSFMRFCFGTVKKEIKPINTYLTDLPNSNIIRFKILIVDESKKHGRILRLADRIKAQNADESVNPNDSILPIDWSQDLNQQIYRINFKTDGPILEINKRIDNRLELMRTNIMFRSLILTSIIKEVTSKILPEINNIQEGEETWQNIWLRYIREILHVNIDANIDYEEESDLDYYVEEVVSAFCTKFKLRSKFQNQLN
jgi:hypothetical protein